MSVGARRGVGRVSWGGLLRAELLATRGTRRIVAIVVVAVAATALAAATAVLLVMTLAPAPAEAVAVAVHRGSGAQVAIAVSVGLLVAGQHRHGTACLAWMQVGGVRRLAGVAVVHAGVAVVLAIASGLLAVIAVGAVAPRGLGSPAGVAGALATHAGLMIVWSLWLVCVATLTRSALATVAVGVLLPLVVEPAASGVLVASGAQLAPRLLPTTALRVLGELGAGAERVVLASGEPADVWLAPLITAAWTLAVLGLTVRRARSRP